MDFGHTIRSLGSMPHMFLGGIPKERAGEERLAWRQLGVQPGGSLTLSCDAFPDGGPIPPEYTADGKNLEPPLRWEGVPEGAGSLVLLVEDPDAPTPLPFVHWLIAAISANAKDVKEALSAGAHVGKSSMLRPTWVGCAPPKGDTPHRYVFQLFAVDRGLDLGDHPGRSALLGALRGHVLACATYTGTYQR